MNPRTNRRINVLVLLVGLLFIAFMLGRAIFGGLKGERIAYWLKQDAKQGVATITAEYQHGVVKYKYTVDGRDFTGTSQRNWDIVKYRNVGVGQESIVYYSSSHPWLSSLQTPQFPTSGIIFLILTFPVECLLLFLAILSGLTLLAMVKKKR